MVLNPLSDDPLHVCFRLFVVEDGKTAYCLRTDEFVQNRDVNDKGYFFGLVGKEVVVVE